MTNDAISRETFSREAGVIARFLEMPGEESFADLFAALTPQLLAFFRARGSASIAEDLAQEVMLTVYQKAAQIRDRGLFRTWMFTIARNAMYRHYGRRTREVETVELSETAQRSVADANISPATPAFEFRQWMDFLEPDEREALRLRFIEQSEYHEIATAQRVPIGTAKWRVFNAKRKLAPHLRRAEVQPLTRAA